MYIVPHVPTSPSRNVKDATREERGEERGSERRGGIAGTPRPLYCTLVCTRVLYYAIFSVGGGQRVSVVRLSLGKLLVNLLQVVKRTNTPQIP